MSNSERGATLNSLTACITYAAVARNVDDSITNTKHQTLLTQETFQQYCLRSSVMTLISEVKILYIQIGHDAKQTV
jgi:hypothetical protein